MRYPHMGGKLLHGYQRHLWWDRAMVRTILKSRRIGVTFEEVGRAVQDACRRNGRTTYYMSHTAWAGRETMQTVERWADFYDAKARKHGRSIWRWGDKRRALSATRALFNGGRKFEVLASSPRLLRGAPDSPHYLLDEVEFHKDPEALLAAASAVLILGTSAITMISTVNGEGPFWQWCQEAVAGKRPYSPHKITFDDALADGLYERVVADQVASPFIAEPWGVDDPELARVLGVPHQPGARDQYRDEMFRSVSDPQQELLCIPRSSVDQYMGPRLVRPCMHQELAVLRWTAPDDWLHRAIGLREVDISAWAEAFLGVLVEHRRNPPRQWYVGTDFGRSRDLTVMSFAYHDGPVLRVALVLELEDCPWDDQALFFDKVRRALAPGTITKARTDGGGPGGPLAEHILRELGDRVAETTHTGIPWYQKWMPEFRKLIEGRALAIPDDPFVLDDIGQIRLIDGVPRVPRKNKRVPSTGKGKARFRHADAAVSLCLLTQAAHRVANTGNYSSTRAKKKRKGMRSMGM